jgi:hypothetical protein
LIAAPLWPHATSNTSGYALEVSLQRPAASHLRLTYQLTGDIAGVRVPAQVAAEFRNELWRHTCFELFIAASNSPAYCEFNFSPSRCWAAYVFADYRLGMRRLDTAPPVVQLERTQRALTLQVDMLLPEQLANVPGWQLGITAVVEDVHGQCSYWALAHPGEQPDFHHRDGFVMRI